MEEMESPVEKIQDEINDIAKEEQERKKSERWTMYVALSTSVIAVLAAITGLMAGQHANEALIYQVKSSDQWSFYQAKSIKYDMTDAMGKILQKMEHADAESNGDMTAKLERYKTEKEDIKKKAEAFAEESNKHLEEHETLARSVTLFQIAIAISAIAILTRKKYIWWGSIVLAGGATYFMLMAIMH